LIAIPARQPARGFEGDERLARAELLPRYEDMTQDGRILLPSLMPGVGVAIWRNLLAHMPALAAFRAQGILPILRRLVLVAGEAGPFSVHAPIAFEGSWRLARERGGERLFVNMWIDAYAPVGHSLGPPPAETAPRVLVGRIFGEHVVTRPFASPEERKVTRLDIPGFPAVPEDEHDFEPGEALLGERPLEPLGTRVFGMMHTDPNQHVNSLVYPRMFEEMVLAEHADPALLARGVELRWRRPFFAGDRAAIAWRRDGDSVVGAFAPAGAPSRPSCTLAMTLAR
jgi:hypothetical protein